MNTNSIKCEFTSVWDDGSIVTTPCLYIPATGKVVPEVSQGEPPSGMVKQEYITLSNGTELDVCLVCHQYILDEDGCPNPSCGQED